MSDLSRALASAREILAINDATRALDNRRRVSPFVATVWCIEEIDELLQRASRLTTDIKVARLESDFEKAQRLVGELRLITHQIHQMAMSSDKAFNREESNGD